MKNWFARLKNWLNNIHSWVKLHHDSLSAWASLFTVVSVPLIFISLFLGYYQIRDILVLPDPSLEFVHPSSIAYKVINKSGKIAEDVLVSFGIIDLDSSKNGPLPIPSVNYDYVNKHSAKGPFSLLSKYAISGHRYFGIVYIGCKSGERLRTYWIYVKHEHPEECFYAERNDKDTYQANTERLAKDPNYIETIIPINRRIPIK